MFFPCESFSIDSLGFASVFFPIGDIDRIVDDMALGECAMHPSELPIISHADDEIHLARMCGIDGGEVHIDESCPLSEDRILGFSGDLGTTKIDEFNTFFTTKILDHTFCEDNLSSFGIDRSRIVCDIDHILVEVYLIEIFVVDSVFSISTTDSLVVVWAEECYVNLHKNLC